MVMVEVLVMRGALLSSVAITLDLLETANRVRAAAGRAPAFDVRISGSGGKAMRAMTGHAAAEPGPCVARVLVTPGLLWMTEDAIREGLARKDAEQARRRLREAAAAGVEIASSCSGVFLVASSGLLDRRRATTAWWLAPVFARLFPTVELDTSVMLSTDGGIVTSGAAMAQLDLMLSIVSRHADPKLAERCARYMLLEERSSQARYMAISFLTGADERVARAERWARARLGESFPMAQLADAAGLSSRTFARRLERTTGMSPVRFVQRLRVERATELLETTRLSFDEIARQVGYAEPSTLRRLLRREGDTGARRIRAAA